MVKINQAIMVETIKHYGGDNQLIVANEEMAELSQVLSKALRKEIIDREHLVEEFADATYMLEQIKVIFKITDDEVNDAIWEKQNRQMNRMLKEKKK